jgi:hypothetical protein
MPTTSPRQMPERWKRRPLRGCSSLLLQDVSAIRRSGSRQDLHDCTRVDEAFLLVGLELVLVVEGLGVVFCVVLWGGLGVLSCVVTRMVEEGLGAECLTLVGFWAIAAGSVVARGS